MLQFCICLCLFHLVYHIALYAICNKKECIPIHLGDLCKYELQLEQFDITIAIRELLQYCVSTGSHSVDRETQTDHFPACNVCYIKVEVMIEATCETVIYRYSRLVNIIFYTFSKLFISSCIMLPLAAYAHTRVLYVVFQY